jgi:hypothetical protein
LLYSLAHGIDCLDCGYREYLIYGDEYLKTLQ